MEGADTLYSRYSDIFTQTGVLNGYHSIVPAIDRVAYPSATVPIGTFDTGAKFKYHMVSTDHILVVLRLRADNCMLLAHRP